MNSGRWRILLGVGLILAGLFSLLDIFNIVNTGAVGWALLFGAAGIAFLYVLSVNRMGNWWAIIPGMTLLGIGVMMIVEMFSPVLFPAGAIFLTFLALAFWGIYIMIPKFWWAIIPAGVLSTLALIDIADGIVRFDVGWLLFLGIAATFGLVYLLPRRHGENTSWAIWPAVGSLAVAAIWMISAIDILRFFWPIGLVIVGGYLVWVALKRDRVSK